MDAVIGESVYRMSINNSFFSVTCTPAGLSLFLQSKNNRRYHSQINMLLTTGEYHAGSRAVDQVVWQF